MKLGAPHWVVIPLALIVSNLGVTVVGPLTVDFLVQDVLSLSEKARPIPMLSIDLILSTSILIAVFYWAAFWAKQPKLRAQSLVAVLLLIYTVWSRYYMGMYKPGVMPVVYEIGVVGTVLVGWLVARSLFVKRNASTPSRG